MAFGFTDLTPEGKRYFQELKKLAEMEVVVGLTKTAPRWLRLPRTTSSARLIHQRDRL